MSRQVESNLRYRTIVRPLETGKAHCDRNESLKEALHQRGVALLEVAVGVVGQAGLEVALPVGGVGPEGSFVS